MRSTVMTTVSPKPPRRCRKPVPAAVPAANQRIVLACRLDRNADALLFLGCHLAAERLAMRAQALRETGR
jgi:hypothetical protein